MDRITRVRRATDIWNPKSTKIIFIIHTEFETIFNYYETADAPSGTQGTPEYGEDIFSHIIL